MLPSPDHHSDFNPAFLSDLGRLSEESALPNVSVSQVCQDRTRKPGLVLPWKGDSGQHPPPQCCRVLSLPWHAMSEATRVSACRARHVPNAGFVPTAGKTLAILRAYMGPSLNQRSALPAGGLELWKGLFYRYG